MNASFTASIRNANLGGGRRLQSQSNLDWARKAAARQAAAQKAK